jgi:hypothetical protein
MLGHELIIDRQYVHKGSMQRVQIDLSSLPSVQAVLRWKKEEYFLRSLLQCNMLQTALRAHSFWTIAYSSKHCSRDLPAR